MTDPKVLTDPGLRELARHAGDVAEGRVTVSRPPGEPTSPPPRIPPPHYGDAPFRPEETVHFEGPEGPAKLAEFMGRPGIMDRVAEGKLGITTDHPGVAGRPPTDPEPDTRPFLLDPTHDELTADGVIDAIAEGKLRVMQSAPPENHRDREHWRQEFGDFDPTTDRGQVLERERRDAVRRNERRRDRWMAGQFP